MTYYAFVKDNQIDGTGQVECLNPEIQNVEITEDVYNSIDHYIWDGSEIILNPDYEQEQEEKEQERIKMLSCTKRDFALLLEELGISYKNTLKPLIESNERASLEWDLCERLYRFNPLLDTMAIGMGITSQQLDMLFKVANGENTVDDLKAV